MRGCTQKTHFARPNPPGWYELYFAAVTEGNEGRAVQQIERARRAMQDRMAEMSCAVAANADELQDLTNALTYLAILLQHVGHEGENLTWD